MDGYTLLSSWRNYNTRHGRSVNLPYGALQRARAVTTEEGWLSFEWNPENTLIVSPKPTWAELVRAHRLEKIDRALGGYPDSINPDDYNGVLNLIKRPVRDALEAGIEHPESESNVHVGSGIDHMAALVHLSDVSKSAGEMWPLAVMRNVEGDEFYMWTADEGEHLLGAVTRKKNRAENALNVVRGNLASLARIAQDPDGRLDASATDEMKLAAREAAVEKIKAVGANYVAEMEEAFKRVDEAAEGLPESPRRAANVLMARLGAEANKTRNLVLDTVAAADSYLNASCIEQERALREVAGERQKGLLAIRRASRTTGTDAEKITAMKAVYDAAVSKLRSVRTLNTPIWQNAAGAVIPPTATGEIEVPLEWTPPTGNYTVIATVKMRNPLQSELTGDRKVADLGEPLVIFVLSDPESTRWSFEQSDTKDANGLYTVELGWLGQDAPPMGALATLIARNACGGSYLPVRIVAPATPAE